MDIVEKFWLNVDRSLGSDRCWNWLKCINSGGYGIFYVKPKLVRAHRYSYVLAKGPIPDGLVIDHLCKNRRCCNPEHLEAITQGENAIRSTLPSCIAYREQRCVKGHELTPENTYVFKQNRRGKTKEAKRCKLCHNANVLRYKHNKRLKLEQKSVEAYAGDEFMPVKPSDLDPIDNPDDSLRAIATRVTELLQRDDLDPFDKRTLEMYLHEQSFTARQIQALTSIWNHYQNPLP